jgi:hypothetical protein
LHRRPVRPRRKRKGTGRIDSIFESCPPNELDGDYRNGKAATPSPLPEIDRTKTGVSGLQND